MLNFGPETSILSNVMSNTTSLCTRCQQSGTQPWGKSQCLLQTIASQLQPSTTLLSTCSCRKLLFMQQARSQCKSSRLKGAHPTLSRVSCSQRCRNCSLSCSVACRSEASWRASPSNLHHVAASELPRRVANSQMQSTATCRRQRLADTP